MVAPPHGGEDWRRRLRKATFRGSHFWVEKDSIRGGRRIVIHEFPLKELPYNEDMGQQARRYEIEAYCVGGKADKEAVGLIKACTDKDAATLVLPLFGSIRCRCVDISSDRTKDKHGYVGFRLAFVADVLSLSSLTGTPQLRSQVGAKAREGMPPALLRSTNSRFATVDEADYVAIAAAALGRDFLANVDVIIDSAALRGEGAARLNITVQGLYNRMDELVDVGSTSPKIESTLYVAGDTYQSSQDLVYSVYDMLGLYEELAPPGVASLGLGQLAYWGAGLDPVPTTTASRQREAANQEALVDLFRRSALAQMAVAVVNTTYPSRREAIAARADIATRFEAEINKISSPDEWELAEAMRDLMGLTIIYLTRLVTDLAPIIILEAGTTLPSLYWAYRLYGDAARSDELWLRNDVKHPAWMPAEFEALVR